MSGVAPVRGVLFDFAGTLAMPEDDVAWVRRGADALGLELGDGEAQELAAAYVAAGRPGGPYPATIPDGLEELYARRDLDPVTHRDAYVGLLATVEGPHADLPRTLYERVRAPDGWTPYPDAAPVLAELRRRGIATGLVSNIAFDARPVLRHHGLAELLDAVVLSFEVGCTKPDPAIFLAGCSALGTEAAETLMVGDHAAADGGAADAGLRTLLLPMSPAGAEHGLAQVLALAQTGAAPLARD